MFVKQPTTKTARTALHFAALAGDVDTCRQLLDAGSSIDSEDSVLMLDNHNFILSIHQHSQ